MIIIHETGAVKAVLLVTSNALLVMQQLCFQQPSTNLPGGLARVIKNLGGEGGSDKTFD